MVSGASRNRLPAALVPVSTYCLTFPLTITSNQPFSIVTKESTLFSTFCGTPLSIPLFGVLQYTSAP
uniref:Uncharacterized protein n=1 Tax=Caenorhabditis japonica TaxID=281687 RepID=A0A8R1I1L8_CAEJA